MIKVTNLATQNVENTGNVKRKLAALAASMLSGALCLTVLTFGSIFQTNAQTAGRLGTTFGTDSPTPADYDGDGKADLAVFRDSVGYLNRSTA